MTWFRCGGIPQSVLNMKTVSGASGSIATFNTDLTDNLVKCVAEINAVQSGTGTPSPINVRSISGWQIVNVVNMSDITNLTYFKGLLKGTHGFVDLGTKNWTYTSTSGAGGGYFSTYLTGRKLGAIYNHMICSKYEITSIRGYSNIPSTTDKVIFCSNNTQTSISIIDSSYTDETTFTNAMSGVYIIYELETPITPTITVEQFNALLANFNIGGCLVQIALGQTVYGGYLDVLSGVLTITHAYYDLANYTGTVTKVNTSNRTYFRFDDLSPYPLILGSGGSIISDKYEQASITASTTDVGVSIGSPSALGHSTVFFRPENPNSYTEATIMTFIQNTLGGLEIVYKLQETDYIKVQLSSNQIATLLQNNILADTGDIDVEFLETVGNKIGG